LIGTQEQWVGEPLIPIYIEFDEVPEAKFLNGVELSNLIRTLGLSKLAVIAIGASEAFVRQNSV
jgi:hypothetical protein